MSPLGSMTMTGMPSRSASSMRHDGEAGLTGAGHADDDAVRGQVGRAQAELVTERFGLRVEDLAEVAGRRPCV